ncbi:ERF family protein [Paraburkholderia sacchari]|uniref:ERF family protein n=1 Tax=Paraburkholderia sacchari TaxID=159450 RepID=UPI001BCF7F04|nr:ERF family protein [Paraburkholderia sacchari]
MQANTADVVDVEHREQPPAQATPPAVHQPAPIQQRAIVSTTPSDLLRIAVEGGADIDKLERLLVLQERWEANEARKAFTAAMSAFKCEPVEIFKKKAVGYNTKDGDFVGYKHAELSDVTDAIAPAMARHGLSFDWDIHQGNNVITVDCVVTHVLGHSKKVTMSGAPDTSGKKNLIQQVASTITYLQRYTLLAATGMSTKDEDDDGAGGADDQPGTDTQQQRNTERQTTQPRATQSKADQPAFYDQKKFDANKATWREMVLNGRKTVAGMIQFIESKGAPLTQEQKNTIDSWSHEND